MGLEPDQLRGLGSAVGLPVGLRGSDVEILEALRVARDSGLPSEAILGATRVIGDSLRRIADTEIRVVHVYMHERLTSAGASEEEVEQLISGIEQYLAPLIDPMLRRLHGENLLEAMMEDAFFHLTGGARRAEVLGSVEVTIAFVDVASFTALVEARGDDAAMRLLDWIDTIVRSLLVERDGKLVKQVGDGFMLAFRDPAAAVQFALATQAELARNPEMPAIRVGINAGPALYRTGDYIGSAVNVASRVATAAMAGQILLTEPVATGQPRIRLQARARSGQFVRLDVPSTRGCESAMSGRWTPSGLGTPVSSVSAPCRRATRASRSELTSRRTATARPVPRPEREPPRNPHQ
jgi:adenylate cyclase